LPLHYADPFERPGSLSATSKLRSFGRARDAWYSKRAFESGAVPVCEISRRLIGAFKKGKQRRVRVRRGPDGVIGQEKLSQTDGSGRVEVCWRLEPGYDGGGPFVISWRERGGPFVRVPASTGFGSTVLRRAAKESLDAQVELDYASTGLVWRLQCPAGKVKERPAVSAQGAERQAGRVS
jgi:hypothetical protein